MQAITNSNNFGPASVPLTSFPMLSNGPAYPLVVLAKYCVVGLAALFISRVVFTVVYRLYFHPLAKVPGPRLGAISWLYEIYFDLYLGGQFIFEIGRLHEIYGMFPIQPT
jgi:hypothetical protein